MPKQSEFEKLLIYVREDGDDSIHMLERNLFDSTGLRVSSRREAAKKFLSVTLNDNASKKAQPLLDYVATKGYVKLLEYLLHKHRVLDEILFGAAWKDPVKIVDSKGNTLLHRVISNPYSQKRPDVVKSIINSGANIKAKNKNGDTPLAIAAKMKSKDIDTILVLLMASKELPTPKEINKMFKKSEQASKNMLLAFLKVFEAMSIVNMNFLESEPQTVAKEIDPAELAVESRSEPIKGASIYESDSESDSDSELEIESGLTSSYGSEPDIHELLREEHDKKVEGLLVEACELNIDMVKGYIDREANNNQQFSNWLIQHASGIGHDELISDVVQESSSTPSAPGSFAR